MSKEKITCNHIGISTTDIERSLKFYTEVFGARVLKAPFEMSSKDSNPEALERRQDIFGKHWGGMWLAHLAIDDGVGIELFQFTEPKQEKADDNFDYWKSGTFHFALTTSDINKTMKAVEEHGGKLRSSLHELSPGVKVIYVEDPDGTVFELLSVTYEEMNS